MRRVVFINPPSPFLQHDRGAPNLGILQLAAILREQRLADVAVWDMTGDLALANQFGGSGAEFVQRFTSLPVWIEHQPDDMIFGITCTSAQYHAAQNLLLGLKWQNPHWRVIIGGPHVSALPNQALADGFDSVFAGEADDALPQWLKDGCPAGIIRCVAPRDLDRLPLPARDLVDLRAYCANLGIGEGFATTTHASRGCPWRCAYCLRELGDLARVYRPRSVAHVVDELEQLHRVYGLRRFTFTDDVFGLRKPWLIALCEAVKGRGFAFRCNIRANYLYDDCLSLMAAAGFKTVSFGMESADDDILKSLSKNTVALNAKAIEACHAAGIAAKCYFIWGFPGDGPESALKLMNFIQRYRPASAQLATLIPLPATPLWDQAVAQGFVADYRQLYHNGKDGKGGIMHLPWWTDETLQWRDYLLRWLEDFYQQPQPGVECPVALSSEVT